jgi:hypothetical protein
MAEQRRDFLGSEQARQVSHEARATSEEPAIDRNPRFAIGRGQDDALERAVEALRAFHTWYRTMLKRWRGGARDVIFPPGTWWMRVFHGASIQDVAAALAG